MGAYISSLDQGDYPVPDGAALQPNANWTLGPLFFGWVMNCFLCGIMLSWCGSYMRRSTGDRSYIKALLAIAVVFQCLTCVTNVISIIQHGVDQDRTNFAISKIYPADALGPAFGSIVALAAQVFFAIRCLSLLPRKWRTLFGLVIGLLIAAGFAAAWTFTAIEFYNKGITDETRGAHPGAYELLNRLANLWLWSNVATDALISGTLLVRLWSSKRGLNPEIALPGSGMRADSLVNSLMRLSFETAALTTFTAAVSAVFYVTMTKTTNVSYATSAMLPGLYALSFLWALLARHRLQREIAIQDNTDTIQVVWNLARKDTEIDTHRALKRIAEGEHLSLSLRRQSLPSKAAATLGHPNIKILQISELQESTPSFHEDQVKLAPFDQPYLGSDLIDDKEGLSSPSTHTSSPSTDSKPPL